MAREGLTVKQLSVLNSHHVPGAGHDGGHAHERLPAVLLPQHLLHAAAGNLGYMLSHVLALSGVLLLRKDRPAWPRPIKLGRLWMF